MFDLATDRGRAIRAALDGLRRLGVEPPAAVKAAQDAAQASQAALDALQARGTDDALTDVLAATLAGKKPDPAVLLAATIGMRPGVLDRHATRLQAAVIAAVRKSVDDIIEAMRPVTEQAAADLDAAAEVLGDVDLDDAAAILARGGDAAAHHGRARAAEKVLTEAAAVVASLARGRVYPELGDHRERALVIADADLSQYKRIPAQATPWQLRRLGCALSLAGPEEYKSRRARIDAAWGRDATNPVNRLGRGVGQYPEVAPREASVVTL